MSSPPRPDQPARGPDPAKGGPPRPAIQHRFPWLWPVLLLALIAWNAYTLLVPRTAPALNLTYSAFLEQVDTGSVASLNIAGQAIDGTFKSPFTPPAEVTVNTPPGASTPAPDAATPTPPISYARFTTVTPPEQYSALVPLLRQ